MKKLFVGILAGILVLGTGCSKKPENEKTPEEMPESYTGEMDFAGNWVDTEDENLTMIITGTGENEYDMIAYLGKTASEAGSWQMHGTYDPSSGTLTYEGGSYCLLKMNPDGKETREDETAVSGSLIVKNETEFLWQDEKLDSERTMTRDPDSLIPVIKLAEGPYVMDNISKTALSEEDKTRFEQAVRGEIGVGYTPVQLLARQIVNGTNYAYLAWGLFDLGIPKSTWVIVKVYEDLQGNAELQSESFLDVNDLHTGTETEKLLGGWEICDNEEDGILNDEADDVFRKALDEGYDGDVGQIVNIALLGTDAENDSVFYRFLVRGTTEEKYPDKQLYVLEIEQAGEACTVKDVSQLDLVYYLEEPAQ